MVSLLPFCVTIGIELNGAFLSGGLDAMNEYMNRVASETFGFFDTGKRASGKAEPERFYGSTTGSCWG